MIVGKSSIDFSCCSAFFSNQVNVRRNAISLLLHYCVYERCMCVCVCLNRYEMKEKWIAKNKLKFIKFWKVLSKNRDFNKKSWHTWQLFKSSLKNVFSKFFQYGEFLKNISSMSWVLIVWKWVVILQVKNMVEYVMNFYSW